MLRYGYLVACLSLLSVEDLNVCDSIVDTLSEIEERFCPETRCKSRGSSANTGQDLNISTLHITLPVTPRDQVYSSCCKPCSCDVTECVIWNTCCLDVLDELPAPEHIGNVISMECQYPQLKSGHDGSQVVNSPIVVNMITSCPTINKGNLINKRRCHNPDNYLLEMHSKWVVTDRTTLYTYRNTHCAVCNGVSNKNFVLWPRAVSCSSDVYLPNKPDQLHNDILERSRCNLIYNMPEMLDSSKSLCPIQQEPITWCNKTGKAKPYDPLLESACRSYTRLYNDTYKNVFCYLCNTDDDVAPTCDSGQPFPSSELFITYSALLNLPDDNPGGRPWVFPTPPTPIDPNQIYDSVKGEYVDMACRFPKTLKNGACVVLVDKLSGVNIDMFLRMVPGTPMTHTELINVYTDVIKAVQALFSTLNIDYYKNSKYFLIYIDSDRLDKQFDDFIVYFRLKPASMDWAVLEDIVGHVTWTIGIDTETNELLRLTTTLSHWHKATQNSVADMWQGKQLHPLVDAGMTFPAFEGHHEMITRFHFCEIVSLVENTTLIKETKFGFYLQTYKAFISFEDAFVKERVSYNLATVTFDICVHTFNGILAGYIPEQSQSLVGPKYNWFTVDVVSFACVVLSLLLSVSTIVVYAIFKQLHTQPGLNTLALAVYICLTQLSFQLGFIRHEGIDSIACIVIGIWIHYSLMLLITWMCICSFHMYKVFCRIAAQPASMSSTVGVGTTTAWYTLCCWCIASVPIISNIVYHLASSGWQTLGYGGSFCYISEDVSIMYVVGIPLSLCTVVNTGLYITVVVHIKRSSMMTSRCLEQRSHIGIYARLSTITGITWVFGLIYIVTGYQWTEYLFVVFNCLQGLFLFLAFVVNKRVGTLCRMCYAERFVFNKKTMATAAQTTVSVQSGAVSSLTERKIVMEQ